MNGPDNDAGLIHASVIGMTTSDHDDESPTNLPSAEPTLAPGRGRLHRRVPTLTVQWHPDVNRVGDSAVLADSRGEVIPVSRREPVFHSPSGPQPGRGLEDGSLSANTVAFAFLETAAGEYQLSRGPARQRVTLNGHPLTGTRSLTDQDLDAGQVIVAGDVTLFLHRSLHPRDPEAADDLGLIGVSDGARALRRSVRDVAAFRKPVFIRGESGAGKTFIARAIHRAGPRAKGPWVEVNLAKVGRELVDSALFGHEKGSFTGALQRHSGYFLQANGGTLFLDEIGHAPIDAQRALLKAVEDGEILPVGAARPIKVDVRIIAGTNANLAEKMRDGSFSEELFNRLNADEIIVPPLRERLEDVGILLLAKLRDELAELGQSDRLDRPTSSNERPWLGASAVGEIVRCATRFRGNIRRLGHIAHWLVVGSGARANADGALTNLIRAMDEDDQLAMDAEAPRAAPNSLPHKPALPNAEEFHRLMEQNGHSLERVAAKLGLSRSTLHRIAQKDPTITKSSDVDDAQILAAWEQAGGDVDKAAALVKLARRHYQQRLAKARRSPS
jgi:two-component system nitrogen regulation response regulator GlnG